MSKEFKFINFIEVDNRTGKTLKFNVHNKEVPIFLGVIKWYSNWRRYAFFSGNDLLFDANCLEDITNFIKSLMADRKK